MDTRTECQLLKGIERAVKRHTNLYTCIASVKRGTFDAGLSVIVSFAKSSSKLGQGHCYLNGNDLCSGVASEAIHNAVIDLQSKADISFEVDRLALNKAISDLFTDIGPTPTQVEPTKTEAQKHVGALKELLAGGLIEPADFASSLRLIRANRGDDQDANSDAARTLSIIKERCETGLKIAEAQKAESDDLCHLNRMVGTIRVCERILGIIEGGGQ